MISNEKISRSVAIGWIELVIIFIGGFMANKHLRRNPSVLKTDIGESWFYEEAHGLTVVHRSISRSCQIKIPWSKIRKSLARKDL